MADHDRILVVDLDGTLYRGDGPVRVYAEGLARAVAPDDGRALVRDVEQFLAGNPAEYLRGSSDAWVAARRAADRRGVSDDAISPAFLAARAALADGTCLVENPAGLVEALDQLAGRVTRILVTNSPDDGLPELLVRLGATDVFDRVVSSAHKPYGLRDLLPGLVRSLPAPHRLLSLGDHWRNDLEPAIELGATAFYVDPFDRREGPAHAHARRVEELLPLLADWSTDPERFVAAHPLRAPGEAETDTETRR